MRRYVLNYLYDPIKGSAFSDVIGIYDRLTDVNNAMMDSFDKKILELKITEKELDANDVYLSKTPTQCSIWHYGDKHNWKIYQFI